MILSEHSTADHHCNQLIAGGPARYNPIPPADFSAESMRNLHAFPHWKACHLCPHEIRTDFFGTDASANRKQIGPTEWG